MKVIVGGDLYDVDKGDIIILELTEELREAVKTAKKDSTAIIMYNTDSLTESESTALLKNAKIVFDDQRY